MNSDLSLISVIIPTYNEEKSLDRCLDSITEQSYPKSKIEILIVDDGSTDQTLRIAKRYGARIIFNGTHHIERGKSIGLSKAKGKYVFFIDADNTLTSRHWFTEAVTILKFHPEAVGVESWHYQYSTHDSLVNRYCALFGINDPLTYYLGKAGFLPAFQDRWANRETLVADYGGYILTRFTTINLTVIGSNGYLTKKAILLKTKWKPYLFHLDSAYDLVQKGYDTFARLKFEVKHDFASSLSEMVKKIKRNADLFFKYQKLRRYKYESSFTTKIKALVFMATFIEPTIEALRGYSRKPDPAWFIHPLISFVNLWIVAISFSQYLIKKYLLKTL